MEEVADVKATGSEKAEGGVAKSLPVLSRKSFVSCRLDVTEAERALIRRAFGNPSPSPSPSESLLDAESSPSVTPKSTQSLSSQRSPAASPHKWKDSLRSETHSRSHKPFITSQPCKFASMTPVLPPSPAGLKKVTDFSELKGKMANRSARTVYPAPNTPPAAKSSPKKKGAGTPPRKKTPNRGHGKRGKGGSQSPVGSTGRGRGNRSPVPRKSFGGSAGSLSPQSSLSDITMPAEEIRGPVLEAEASFSSAEGSSMAELQGLLGDSQNAHSLSVLRGLALEGEPQAGSAASVRLKEKRGLSVGPSLGLVPELGKETDNVGSSLGGRTEGLAGSAGLDHPQKTSLVGGDNRDDVAGGSPRIKTQKVRAQLHSKEDEEANVASEPPPNAPDAGPNSPNTANCLVTLKPSIELPAGKPSLVDVTSDLASRLPTRAEGFPSSRLRLLHVTDSGVTVEDESSRLSPDNLQRTAKDLVGADFSIETTPGSELCDDVSEADADVRASDADVSARDADGSGTAAEEKGQSLSAGDVQTLTEENSNPRLDTVRLSLSPSRIGQLARVTAGAEVLRGPDGGVGIAPAERVLRGPAEGVLRGTKSDTATILADRRTSFEDELEMGGWRGQVSEQPEICDDVAGSGLRSGRARVGSSGESEGFASTGLGLGMELCPPSSSDANIGRLISIAAGDNEAVGGTKIESGEKSGVGEEIDVVERGGVAKEGDEGLAELEADALRNGLLGDPDRMRLKMAGDLQLEDVLRCKKQLKQKFARLLLGNDMSGGSLGVSPALAVSNAITELAATVFGDVCALEPLMPTTRLLWTREIEWLVAPASHVVEMRPGWIVTPEGKKTEVMQRMPRGDIQASLPVLQKLNGLLLDTLDTLVGKEFSYRSKRRSSASEKNTWWRPKAQVPPGGLSDEGLRKLRGQKEVATNVYAVATAINAQTLGEIEIPEEYWDSLPKSSKAALGDDLYRVVTDEGFDVDATVSSLAIDNQRAAASIASDLEAAVHLWQRKITKRGQDDSGNSLRVRMESMTGHSAEQRERWAQRASALLQTVLATFPALPRTRLAESKVRYNKDVGRAILESYSRVLASVASNLLAGFNYVLELHEEAYSLRKALRASLDYQDFQDSPTSMLVNPAPTPPGGSRRGSSSAGEDLEVLAEGGRFALRRNPLQQWVVLEGRSARSQSPARFVTGAGTVIGRAPRALHT